MHLFCLGKVAITGESILITKHGKPIAELKAHQPPRAKSLLGLDKGKIEILGDIIAPAYDGECDALK
jgi:antitoxin (DNA-binding transcriptional repressor) of toxin-antitoxin stability system